MGEPANYNLANGETPETAAGSTSTTPTAPPPPRPPANKKKPTKVFRLVRSVFRSFPAMAPAALCKLPALPGGIPDGRRNPSSGKVTGTLFGPHKGRVSLSVQENPRCMTPLLLVELAMQTSLLQKEMSSGLVRIALECEKRPEKTRIFDEPVWTMYCNGKKSGYSVKRDPSDEDLGVMELLRMVSMGAGVLPGIRSQTDGPDAELAYIRAHFERVVGSRDSETLYMLSPDPSNGPDLSIFFVRL